MAVDGCMCCPMFAVLLVQRVFCCCSVWPVRVFDVCVPLPGGALCLLRASQEVICGTARCDSLATVSTHGPWSLLCIFRSFWLTHGGSGNAQVVATGESALYGNLIIKKGVLGPDEELA